MDQCTRTGIFQHPQRPIGTLFHIAQTKPYIPAFRRLCAAVAVEDNAVQRRAPQPADEAVSIPLRKGFLAGVKHQIAWRNHRNPIEYGLRQIWPRVRLRDGNMIVVVAIRDKRPAIVFASLNQVQLIATQRPMLHFPQFARR